MTKPIAGEGELNPAAAQAVARVRRLMVISLLITVVAIGVVLMVIGYRVFRGEGSGAPADVTATLPKGARVVATAVADGRIVVTIEVAGQTEVRTFDLKTLKPTGRLSLPVEP
jgi:heme/copper-type cytochrome/quinol oxidase subunit 2